MPDKLVPATRNDQARLREEILDLVGQYFELSHGPTAFEPGVTTVPPSGKVFGAEEGRSLVDSALDFWLTTGRFNEQFEKRLSKIADRKYTLTTNSGSSANLLAVSAMMSPQAGARRLTPGDEVVTVAAGFPTTVNPILQNGLVPVFVDVDIPTYNVDVEALEAAISERTRAIVLAHTLGNPYDLARVVALAEKHDLWLIEDCCDALGSTYDGRTVGTFGDIATLSFYPAHHITMGEGGAVLTANSTIKRILESLRDWGRDCWCAPGQENTCKKRYDWELGDLPCGYDHKYIYTHAGYNLKITDMQAAAALPQLDRLDGFIAARRSNFAYLHRGLTDLEDVFELPAPTPKSDPSWFGFAITLRPDAPFGREDLLRFLEARKVGSRLLFGGNLTKQPFMAERDFRIVGELSNTDRIMFGTFWLGVFPGLTEAHLDFVIDSLHQFVDQSGRPRR